jgi:hypothetical protein
MQITDILDQHVNISLNESLKFEWILNLTLVYNTLKTGTLVRPLVVGIGSEKTFLTHWKKRLLAGLGSSYLVCSTLLLKETDVSFKKRKMRQKVWKIKDDITSRLLRSSPWPRPWGGWCSSHQTSRATGQSKGWEIIRGRTQNPASTYLWGIII